MLGEVGIGYSDFWEMTPRETWNACRGYNEKFQKWFRVTWEQSRWMGTQARNIMMKNPVQPTDLLSFPWDEENKEEQINDGLRKLKEYKEKWRRP